MTDKPKCPECGSLALNIGGGCVTAMPSPSHTDEDGRVHNHDPNWYDQTYSCRKCPTVFTVQQQPLCWCGWPDKEKDHERTDAPAPE